MLEEKKILKVPKNIFLMGLASFFNDIASEMVLSAFPAFFIGVLKSGASSLGAMEGLAEGLANFVKIISGRLSDKWKKRKPFAVFGYTISTLTRLFYPSMTTISPVAGLRALDRVGKGLREPPRDALISLSVSGKELGKSFGYHRGMDALGAIVGPIIAYFILSNFQNNFKILFYASFFIGILSLFAFFFVKEADEERDKINFVQEKKAMPKIVIVAFFVSALGTLPVALILLKVEDLGFNISSIPLFYLVYSVFFTFASFFFVKDADIKGDRKMMVLGYILFVFAYIFFIANNVFSFLFGLAMFGFGASIIDSVQRSYVARRIDGAKRGKIFGYLNASTGLGLILSGILGGLLWEGSGAVFALCFGIVFSIFGAIFFNLNNQRYISKSQTF